MDGGSGATEPDLTHRERRVVFSRLVSELVLWANKQQGWELAYDEVGIQSPRQMRSTRNGATFPAYDAVHTQGSFHHVGLAADLLLYINGQYISDGKHPAWMTIGEHWEAMHPLATWGGRFRDANHLSLGEALASKPRHDA